MLSLVICDVPLKESLQVEPSAVLAWYDCYKSLQCARLIVPLNYSDPQGATAAIALARIPSSIPVESPDYRGPVLLNPGGPGGSGVDFVVSIGETIGTILGPQFDVIGFDPRGIARSTPRISFFDTPAERALWGTAPGIIGNGSGVDGLASEWARAQILGKLALAHDHNVLAHMNTENTARDMLQIVQAHKREKLQYWGFSYGTVLGATFATIFPDKVERLVIDGVVDAENYYATLWNNNLLDTDKTLQTFFDGCAQAGPDVCPFYAPTPEQISQNLTALYTAIKTQPVPVFTESGYGLVDYARLQGTIFLSLYSPYESFLPLAKGLADLASGDGRAFFNISAAPIFECSCDGPDPSTDKATEAILGIICTDGQAVPRDLESTKKFYEQFSNISRWADVWAPLHISCSKVGWPNSIPKPRFQGPFVANTSFPLLLVGNTADPVAPLWAAKKMSSGFPGSVVLTQDSPGHCSISGPSVCTFGHVRDYFVDGKLPPVDEICPVISTPFQNQTVPGGVMGRSSFASEPVSPEDREILDAIQQIHSARLFATAHTRRFGGSGLL
ncbi:alpha/beta hydrolase fold-domain-containing protein [Infundibulicybe gibba]|nr:alpha/beta hydrolase fold-domain-containing protein [Infundibulicybe gibba]